jgi:hypothetical protein
MQRKQDGSTNLMIKTSVSLMMLGFVWLIATERLSWYPLTGNEDLFSGLVLLLTGKRWDAYLDSPYYEAWPRALLLASVGILVSGLLLSWLKPYAVRLSGALLMLSGLVIFSLILLQSFDRGFAGIRMMEHSLQWSAVFVLMLTTRGEALGGPLRWLMRICCALTFAGHGLFAMNVLPVPVHFVDMTMQILSLSEEQARQFLWLAGALDILAAILIWLPGRWRKAGLYYMVVWGLLTTLARYAANVNLSLPWWPQAFIHWTPEVLIRVVHFMIPLVLLQEESKLKTTK